MDTPLGYFLTWTTYGTWLPGDARGWVDGATHEVHFAPDPRREEHARQLMLEEPLTLTVAQRELVEKTIRDHCAIRGWELWTVNVRTCHVHVVISLSCGPDKGLRELKAWCTRQLKEAYAGRERWWTEGGSKRYLWTQEDLESVVVYVREWQ